MQQKHCSKCKELKSLDDFHKKKDSKDGRRYVCKVCISIRNKERYNKEYEREFKLLKNYGITIEEYNQMFQDQQGCCNICSRHQSEFKKALCVDHCHTTGRVRGLLCKHCNVALGQLQDNPRLILNAYNYLLKYKQEEGDTLDHPLEVLLVK